ncbi:PhnD/SsuA/transferrin family substrate-binding protein [Humitalea sp. 24SJ18S-53]|uniref:PhnD/SsuA/transferrin family substrate-binding protein n=1 Tax=Humitalea sp. 24SJ18S-53 TaxID=3422307 RepID=UPI003D675581
MTVQISLACERYDRVQAIFDGRVRIEGCEVTPVVLRAEEAFHRAFNGAEFDVTELSCSSYMMTLSRGEQPYIAVPAFVSKVFRHSAIYVRADRGIETPQDLVGRRIGLPEYQMTACLWARGILEDEYGVRPRDIKWFTGGQDEAGRRERAALSVDPSVSITPIPHDRTLTEMFESGELDGLVTARVPRGIGTNPLLRRLFPNPRATEQAYFRKTGIFPLMHMIGIRRTLLEKHPWLAVSVYKAFVQAKAIAIHELSDAGVNFVTLPWVNEEVLEAQAFLARDYWSYGIEANRSAIEAMARYSFTQGLSQRHLSVEELFHPGTLEISKV